MNLIAKLISAVAIGCATIANAAPQCDATIIEALKTNYTRVTTNSLADVAKELSCKDDGKKIDGTVPDYGSLSFSETQKACKSNNTVFFSEYAQIITTSYMSNESLAAITAICGTKNAGLTLEGSDAGDSIVLKAKWELQVNNVPAPIIEAFGFDKTKFTCDPVTFKKKVKVLPGGVIQTCSRIKDQNGVFTLQTSQGDVSAVVMKPVKKAHYVVTLYAADDQIACDFNGVQIASASIFSPPQVITLTPIPGPNILTFRPKDNQGADGHPCWGFGYNVTADGVSVSSANNTCCVSGCPSQPAPQTFTFQY